VEPLSKIGLAFIAAYSFNVMCFKRDNLFEFNFQDVKESIKIQGFLKITCYGPTDCFFTDCKRNCTDFDFSRKLRIRDVQ